MWVRSECFIQIHPDIGVLDIAVRENDGLAVVTTGMSSVVTGVEFGDFDNVQTE
jgi:hypothetical protein